ncbi:hypothetical protein HOK68_01880 [Candidatus Woesearchaeota archaeon]|jgi:tetratricopeptide (TPR) repeat protein|nr:hypothetical protein [Candidatus Woesearchaeota archaeon]MBT4388020.1 hypothetical protein [Candidatus Woesearchaeota archaeon]MBT4596285.1 hypothetical protein [Candidatus Woesearchaeota archaeon]MBT5740787.1 hypothetical protein [Candidatus Woesearchaeota archaeon]MBT6505510.1 hypothetical protein [Candidatus Woesearchaeota archaeon]
MDESKVSVWKKTIAVNNKSIDSYYKLGKYYLEKEKLGPAKECFDHVLKIEPELSTGWSPKRLEDTYICLSIIAEKKDDFSESLNKLKQLIKIAPKGEYMIIVSELLIKLKKYDAALDLLNKAILKYMEKDLETKAKKLIVKIMTIKGQI